MTTPRTIAIDVLNRVLYGDAYSHIALSAALDESDLDERDRGLATELAYGTLTRKRTIDAVLENFVNRPLEQVDRPILLALRLATYQLLFLDRIPPHAAVNEAVEYIKEECSRGASGFTNGVLRSMLRKKKSWNVWEKVDPEKNPVLHLGLRHSMPNWIAELLIDENGFDRAMKLAKAFNGRPPLYLRALEEAPDPLPEGLEVVEDVPGAYRAEQMSTEIREAVEAHRLVVQDLGSQLISLYSTPENAERILDGCAGLGGKTLHLARLSEDASVVAVEPYRSKLKLLHETVSGTDLEPRIKRYQTTLDKLSDDAGDFDLVLVDAPCSGLGVIRRHPETRWRKDPDDIETLTALQKKLLNDAAPRVRPGGLLVYSVCTFTVAEGKGGIDTFLENHPDFERESVPADHELDWSKYTDDEGDLLLNPADHDTDAFFAARLRRKSE